MAVQTIKMEHVGIIAQGDLFEPTVAFYEQVFGWTKLRESHAPARLAFLSDGSGGVIEIIDTSGPGVFNPAHLAFHVAAVDFDATRNRLAEAGVAFDPTIRTPAGDLLAFFDDPAGNRGQLVGRVTALLG
jgi:predicted enzyme related to lactoylglutathione lyase